MKEEKDFMHNRNMLDAWKNAFNGMVYALKTQTSIKIQIIVAILAVILGAVLKLNSIEWLFLFLAIFIVIITEMVNTCIETVVDLYTEKFHEKAKIAKDVGAAAVIFAALNSVIVAYFLFFDKIIGIFTKM